MAEIQPPAQPEGAEDQESHLLDVFRSRTDGVNLDVRVETGRGHGSAIGIISEGISFDCH